MEMMEMNFHSSYKKKKPMLGNSVLSQRILCSEKGLDTVMMPLHLVNERSHLIQAKCKTAERKLAFEWLEYLKYKWMGQDQTLFLKESITRRPLTTVKLSFAGAVKASFAGN